MSALAIPYQAPEVRPRHLRVITDEEAQRIGGELLAASQLRQERARQQARAARTVAAERNRIVLTARGRLAKRIVLSLVAVALTVAVGVAAGLAFRPATVPGELIEVAPGQSLWAIAATLPGNIDDNVAQIMSLNGLDSSELQVGAELVLPAQQ